MKTPNTMKKNNIMQEIWVQRKICTMNYFKYPDFVMINPINKREIEEQMMFPHAIIDGEDYQCFGMKVIFTPSVDENKVICTFDGSKKI